MSCGWMEALHSPMIQPQSFSESMPLDCEVHKCFSVPSQVGQMARLGLSWVNPFLPLKDQSQMELRPRSLGSDKTPAGQALEVSP